LTSKIYNGFVRTLSGSRVKDHQCGFKAFRRIPLLKILDEVNAKHWFWDTEIIVRFAEAGYNIKEIPVEWKGKGKTKVNLFKDSISMAKQMIKLWYELKFNN
jgi:hypothetical protein